MINYFVLSVGLVNRSCSSEFMTNIIAIGVSN